MMTPQEFDDLRDKFGLTNSEFCALFFYDTWPGYLQTRTRQESRGMSVDHRREVLMRSLVGIPQYFEWVIFQPPYLDDKRLDSRRKFAKGRRELHAAATASGSLV
jgi:hypothetical protein